MTEANKEASTEEDASDLNSTGEHIEVEGCNEPGDGATHSASQIQEVDEDVSKGRGPDGTGRSVLD